MSHTEQKAKDREIIDNSDIVKVVDKFVPLKKKGREHVGVCPFHDDKHASLSVNGKMQIFKCFACGEGGDVVDFLMKMGARTFRDAVNELNGMDSIVVDPAQREAYQKEGPKWKAIVPAPEGVKSPDFNHFKHGHPIKVWQYKDPQGRVIGYVCRFNLPGSKKETLPMVYATDGNFSEWRWKGFPEPRPIYGLDKQSDKPFILVEGEKTRDAALKMFPNNDVYAWQGGTNTTHLVDWSPLYGRKGILFPDNDTPGWLAMVGGFKKNNKTGDFREVQGIADILKDKCPVLKVVMPNDEFPKAWDIADVQWTPEEAKQYVKNRLRNAAEVREKTAPIPEESMVIDEQESIENFDDTTPPAEDQGVPFRCLGYNKTESGQSEFYVYSYKAKQALRFTAQSLTKSSLMQLASTSFWEERFAAKKDFDVDAACEFVINTCYNLGVYDADNLRGIGAWLDNKKIVIHAGDRLIIDGARHDLDKFETRYIYEANKPFGFELKDPLTMREANRLVKLFDLMSWERPVNAYLLAGWCIISPVCGALHWRPHIWLTGGAGTGKSTIFGIIRTVIGKMALAVQGNTTEAGIRQELNQDARPVIFDEIDNDSKSDTERIQSILSMVRASSVFDGGKIIKGGSMGTNKSYKLRSCFAFASITPQVSTTADKSRVTILSLKRVTAESFKVDNWEKIQKEMAEIIHPEWCEKLQSRTIKVLPIILENSRIFTRAAAAHLGEQRAGDQLGVLLAGAYSLFSNKVITYEKALEWVKSKDWTDIRSDERDEVNLYNYLIGATFTASTEAGSRIEKTIGELIVIASTEPPPMTMDPNDSVPLEFMRQEDADINLRRAGFKIEGDRFVIANKSNWIDKVLLGTPWAKGHSKVLLRLSGAEAVQSTTFSTGIKGRGVSLPISIVKDNTID